MISKWMDRFVEWIIFPLILVNIFIVTGFLWLLVTTVEWADKKLEGKR